MTRAAFLFLVSVAVPAAAQAGKPPAEVPVTVLFRDTLASPDPDRIRSDGGLYENGILNVSAIFMPRGDLHLVTNISRNPAIRTLFLDFSYQAISVAPNLKPFVTGFTQANLMNIILKPDGTVDIGGLRDIPLNEFKNTAVSVTFDDPDPSKDLQWKILFGYYDINMNLAKASHSRDDQGDYWVLEANFPTDVAKLQSAPKKGKGSVEWTTEGYYHMPFRLIVRKQ